MEEIKFKIDDNVVFFNTDNLKLISGQVYSITATYRKTIDDGKCYIDINYGIKNEKTWYCGINQQFVFNNKKEFYNKVD